MAIDCDIDSLLENSKCFQAPCIGAEDRLGMLIYLFVTQLAAAGGNDYSADQTVLGDAAKEFQTLGDDQIDAIKLYIASRNLVAVSPEADVSVEAIKEGAKCYACWGTQFKKQVLLALKCQLNSAGEPG